MFSKFIRKATLTVAAVIAGIGLVASPAAAAEGALDDAAQETAVVGSATGIDQLPAPDGISEAEWSDAINKAEDKFGTGDKAYLEALKAISPMLVTYCYDYENITPGGAWYKIPRAGDTFDCVLELGNSNGAVTVLQQTLNYCYGQGLVLDGAFGTATYNALMYAQSVEGIGVDGVYGPITRSNIKWWGGGSICSYGWAIGL